VGPNGNGTAHNRQRLEKVVIRFAGDAGDGMHYRQISGNTALAYGIVAAGTRAPITPASDILHETWTVD